MTKRHYLKYLVEQEKLEKNNHDKNFNQELMNLVEKRIRITRQKLNLENINQ